MPAKSVFLPVILISLFILLSSCSPAPAIVNPGASSSSTAEYPAPVGQGLAVPGYPTPDLSNMQAVPYPSTTEIKIDLPPDPPVSAPEPETGKASISGALFSYTQKVRLAGTISYLTPATGDHKDQMPSVLIGPNAEKGDYAFKTDDKGNFELNNIPPGKYFMIVQAPLTWDEVVTSETDMKPLLFDLQANQKHILGTLVVSWP
jgi:hypothetical protein